MWKGFLSCFQHFQYWWGGSPTLIIVFDKVTLPSGGQYQYEHSDTLQNATRLLVHREQTDLRDTNQKLIYSYARNLSNMSSRSSNNKKNHLFETTLNDFLFFIIVQKGATQKGKDKLQTQRGHGGCSKKKKKTAVCGGRPQACPPEKHLMTRSVEPIQAVEANVLLNRHSGGGVCSSWMIGKDCVHVHVCPQRKRPGLNWSVHGKSNAIIRDL